MSTPKSEKNELTNLDLMLFDECAEKLEQALARSDDDRIKIRDFVNETRTLSMFLVSELLEPEQAERVRHILNRTRL